MTRKRRKNPKTTEAQIIESNPKRYQMYRNQSKDKQESTIEHKRKVADIYKMRAKEVAAVEKKVEKELKLKYQDRMNNPNIKYLGKDYSSINSSALNNLNEQIRVNIDPTKNAKILEQILHK